MTRPLLSPPPSACKLPGKPAYLLFSKEHLWPSKLKSDYQKRSIRKAKKWSNLFCPTTYPGLHRSRARRTGLLPGQPKSRKRPSSGRYPTAETHSRAFLELAEPKLPELTRENRARLLMQSPTRLYFYWSVGKNPFHTLNRAIGGGTGSYTLVLKLIDLKAIPKRYIRSNLTGHGGSTSMPARNIGPRSVFMLQTGHTCG